MNQVHSKIAHIRHNFFFIGPPPYQSGNVPTHFSGNNLIYTLQFVLNTNQSSPGCESSAIPPVDQMYSINPTTGEVIQNVVQGGFCVFDLTVTATNNCGSASGSFVGEVDVFT